MLNYRAIEIFTNEEARSGHQPVADAVVDYIKGLKIAARCSVFRGIAGCYENGEVATGRLEILSYNLPIRIYILLPAAAVDRVLAGLDGLVTDGIIALHDLTVTSHKAATTFFPRQLTVGDVMTPQPQAITVDNPLIDAARLLLSSIYTGLPVVDQRQRPIGIITQGDLLSRGGLPLRLGLLAESEHEVLDAITGSLASKRVAEVMTAPAVTIGADRQLGEAVDLMLAKRLKRLPVTGPEGTLVGMLSRLDIFQTVMREAPDWRAFQAQQISLGNLRTVADITRRDTLTVRPDIPIDQVIRLIDSNDLQRVAVVDDDGTLLGLIADEDLLRYFKPGREGLGYLFSRFARIFQGEPPADHDIQRRIASATAGEVMHTDPPTAREAMLIEDAIRLMTKQRLKRLPVVDDSNRFTGMISRDSLLRAGYHRLTAL
jgi:CBS domain-containing protein